MSTQKLPQRLELDRACRRVRHYWNVLEQVAWFLFLWPWGPRQPKTYGKMLTNAYTLGSLGPTGLGVWLPAGSLSLNMGGAEKVVHARGLRWRCIYSV